MKSKLLIIVSLLTFLPLLTGGCQKSPINGDLDGQWQVMDVSPALSDTPDARFYMCFYLHVCQLSIDGPVWTTGNMSYDGSSLSLDFPDAEENELKDFYKFYGIDSNPVTFTVKSINGKSMVLTNGPTTVTLRKF